jgi:hypothetical protein
MSRMRVTLDVDSPAQEALLRQYLVFLQEIEQLALDAPEGHVLDMCEAAALEKGREVSRRTLEQAVQKRISTAEKKGRRCGPADAVGRA